MMGHSSLASFAATYGGVLLMPDCQMAGLSIDSRKVAPKDIFVAIRGQRFDGHNFLDEAIKQGASGLVVEQPARHLPAPQWVVENTTLALGQIAREVRRASTAAVVGITGSTGKTTVKTMVAEILRQIGPVLATEGNLNNEIGVPLSLLRLQPEHRFAVIEMGAAQVGDIGYLGQIVMPDVALVNNVGIAHLERFGSRRNIVQAKGEIYESLGAAGTAVINLDSEGADHFVSVAPERQVLFSMRAGCGAQIWVENIELQASTSHFDLCTPDWRVQIVLGVLGPANIENALAAAAVAMALGATPEAIQAGLAAARPVPGRLTPLAGLNGALVLDDSYNANPVSVAAAIKALRQFPGRSVLVLGNMGELGVDGPALHEEIGALAKAEGVHLFLGIGNLAAKACLGFGADARHFDNLDELAAYAVEAMAVGEVWLIKGSRSAGLDRLVDKLTTSEGSTCSSG